MPFRDSYFAFPILGRNNQMMKIKNGLSWLIRSKDFVKSQN